MVNVFYSIVVNMPNYSIKSALKRKLEQPRVSYNLHPRAVQVSGVPYVVYVPIVENMANYSVKSAP